MICRSGYSGGAFSLKSPARYHTVFREAREPKIPDSPSRHHLPAETGFHRPLLASHTLPQNQGIWSGLLVKDVICKPSKEVMRPMLYGAMNFPVRPVVKELESISEMGFDFLELTMDPPQAHRKTILEQQEVLFEALERFNMGLVCHLPTFVSTADLTDSLREASVNEVLESLKVAADFQPLKVVLHPSYFKGLSIFVLEQAKRYAMRSLDTIVERAHQLGLCLCLENMFPRSQWLVHPEEFVEILERFPTLNITLDTGHAHIGDKSGRKILDFIEEFPDRIGHVHASDNFGKEDDHLPLGAGTVDFPEIIKALKYIGYNDTVTFEVFSKDRDYLKISRKKFAAMLEAL
jgi:sugar phosphate isomerase/epimerase